MFGNRMGFHLDDFTMQQAIAGPQTNAFLQPLDQALVLLHRAGTHGHMVVLGENPGIEIW